MEQMNHIKLLPLSDNPRVINRHKIKAPLLRLRNLHSVSLKEGLSQLIDDEFLYLKEIKHKRWNSSSSVLFAPAIKDNFFIGEISLEYTTNDDCDVLSVMSEPPRLLETAHTFCMENAIDTYNSKVFVGNISYKVRERELWDFFEYFGKVLRCSILKDRKTKRSRGFGFVIFANPFDADKAVKATNYELKLDGRVMAVFWAEKKRGHKQYLGEKGKQKIKDATDIFLKTQFEHEGASVGLQKELDGESIPISVESLNDDIFLYIFSYLDLRSKVKVEMVCHKWQNLALKSWEQVKCLKFDNVFKSFQGIGGLTDRVLFSLLKKVSQNLKVLDLSSSPYLVTNKSLVKIGDCCPNLESLDLTYVPIRNASLKDLGKKCTKLKHLYFKSCHNVGEKGLWWMLKDLYQLQCLHIVDSTKLQGKCLYMLPNTVTTLDISGCTNLSDSGLENISTKCPLLTTLSITGCSSVTDNGMQQLFKGCSKIECLAFGGKFLSVTSNGMISLTKLFNLVSLDLHHNLAVTEEIVKALAKNCGLIRSLNLEACHGGITCSGIKALAQFHHLENLNLSYIVEVCDDCIRPLVIEGRIRRLLLRSCNQLTNIALTDILLYLEHLEHLDVSSCFRITDEFINDSYINKRNSQLPTLEIVLGNTEVTGEGVELLIQKLHPCSISMQSLSNRNLRNDDDPTLTGRFFPSSDDDEDEQEELPVVLSRQRLEVQLDANVEIEETDELFVSWTPANGSQKSTSSQGVSSCIDETLRRTVLVANEATCEEDWDTEPYDGPAWVLPDEAIKPHLGMVDYTKIIESDEHDILSNDDPLNDGYYNLS